MEVDAGPEGIAAYRLMSREKLYQYYSQSFIWKSILNKNISDDQHYSFES